MHDLFGGFNHDGCARAVAAHQLSALLLQARHRAALLPDCASRTNVMCSCLKPPCCSRCCEAPPVLPLRPAVLRSAEVLCRPAAALLAGLQVLRSTQVLRARPAAALRPGSEVLRSPQVLCSGPCAAARLCSEVLRSPEVLCRPNCCPAPKCCEAPQVLCAGPDLLPGSRCCEAPKCCAPAACCAPKCCEAPKCCAPAPTCCPAPGCPQSAELRLPGHDRLLQQRLQLLRHSSVFTDWIHGHHHSKGVCYQYQEVKCCCADPCEVAELIYKSQTACYGRQRARAVRQAR